MTDQLELLSEITGKSADELVAQLTAVLKQHGWLTRKRLAKILLWQEREIRAVAESAGADIVRGPKGFNCFDRATLEEINHAAKIAQSQGHKMIEYAKKLRLRASARETTETQTAPTNDTNRLP